MQAVFLEGEGGIGKTRLLNETLSLAQARDFQVFQGRSEELERSRPFGPLADALGCRRRSSDPHRAAIARLLSGEGAEGDSGAAEGPGIRYQILEEFLDLIEGLTEKGPLIFALEDLHWSDPSTLLAVRALVRRLTHLPVVLLATFRSLPVRPELERLVEACLAEGALHLRLGSIDEEAVAALVIEVVGASPGPRLLAEVSTAGGNPFFVLELLKAQIGGNAIVLDRGQADVRRQGLPPTLRLTVLRRLNILSPTTLEVLRLASILGAAFSLGDLSVVCRRSVAKLLPALEQAMRAGFLDEAGGEIVFRHSLVREAVYEDLPSSVRNGLHREMGQALADAGAPAVRAATHLAIGAQRGDTEAVEWLARAGRQVARRAPARAAELLEHALELSDPSDPRRGGLLAEVVDVLVWSGRVFEAENLARQAMGRSHHSAMEACLRLALGRGLIMLGRPQEALEVYESTRGPLSESEGVQLQADLSRALSMTGRLQRAEVVAAAAREMSAKLMQPYANAVAISALCDVAMFGGRLREAVGLAEEAVRLMKATDDAWLSRVTAEPWLGICLIEADRLEEARTTIQAGRRRAEEQADVCMLPLLHWALGLCRFLQGEWDQASSDIRTGLAMTGEEGPRIGVHFAHSTLALIALHRGELETAEKRLQAAEREPTISYLLNWPTWVRGLLHETRHNLAHALATLERAAERCTRLGLLYEYPMLGPDIVRLALLAGNRSRARAVTHMVEKASLRMGTASAEGAALRCRGLFEADLEILLASADAYSRSPRPLQRALSFEEAGVACGRSGRRDEAISLLDKALAIFENLGARLDFARAASSLRSLGIVRGRRGPRKRPTTGWESLTTTESEVIRLVAQGFTNRQIGQRLFISPRTVETHVSHLFSKLGCSSRDHLRAEMARREEHPPIFRKPVERDSSRRDSANS